jgi:hypothetical protein
MKIYYIIVIGRRKLSDGIIHSYQKLYLLLEERFDTVEPFMIVISNYLKLRQMEVTK